MKSEILKNYQVALNALKEKIRSVRLNVVFLVNTRLLQTYWEVGKFILEQELQEGWGAGVVETLSKDLKSEFTDIRGFSPRNLRYMRDFAVAYPNFPFLQVGLAKSNGDSVPGDQDEILQGPLAKLSWYHHITLLTKVKEPLIRKFYVEKTIENGWSRDTLVHHIEAALHKRQGQLHSNFKATLGDTQSELVQQIFKDPYKFEFIFLGDEAKERDLEEALLKQITKFLLELGQWFSFFGRQFRVNLGENEYFFDLVFYHTRLKRYIIIELKIGDFKPEHIGKMDLYLQLADEQLKAKDDGNSIGLILCKTKDGLIAEYALRDAKKLIGISQYNLNENLPDNIKGELPTIEEIEHRLEEEIKILTSPLEKRIQKLKQKLSALKHDEVKTPATYEIFCRLFDNSIKLLQIRLMEKLTQFNLDFISSDYFWFVGDSNVKNLEAFEIAWKQEQTFKKFRDLYFSYRLFGLKMAGTETFNTGIQFHYYMDTYWYGFKLVNYKNQEIFFKKLYDRDLDSNEIENITDIVVEFLIEDIESRLDYLDKRFAQ